MHFWYVATLAVLLPQDATARGDLLELEERYIERMKLAKNKVRRNGGGKVAVVRVMVRSHRAHKALQEEGEYITLFLCVVVG